ncbi:helix-turn-helix domain-containing protein [Thermicanus aegyptius]|uniref:helix-turn-helix domain-containing protein n=1 Tax=Thermicanus aegyptius TaxID=94009 RepID=UPI00041B27F8|nr:helix-turn-helix transcriptional regulator [Thermicanus aegyptius]
MENLFREIGRKLKKAREENGLTQLQVGKYLGVAREQISYFETGSREIDLLSLSKLADLYGYPSEYFLSASETAEEHDSVAMAFRATGLSEKDLDLLARCQRFLFNLKWLDELLEGETKR